MPDPTLKNVFEAILKYGHDEDFAPKQGEAFKATQAPAGTREKLEVLADRVRRGQPLWHDDDRADYSGLTGAIRPRDERRKAPLQVRAKKALTPSQPHPLLRRRCFFAR